MFLINPIWLRFCPAGSFASRANTCGLAPSPPCHTQFLPPWDRVCTQPGRGIHWAPSRDCGREVWANVAFHIPHAPPAISVGTQSGFLRGALDPTTVWPFS